VHDSRDDAGRSQAPHFVDSLSDAIVELVLMQAV
jgi:hypothetical protein